MNNIDPESVEVTVEAEQIYLDAREIRDLGKRCAFIEKRCMSKRELQHAVNHLLAIDAEAEALFENTTRLEISVEDLIDTLNNMLEPKEKLQAAPNNGDQSIAAAP